jgi:AcrR family transcriptional regulator
MRTRDEQKEKLIREKALKMIVREGFDGFSMQKLAKAAGVSPATLYIYYRNREDLINNLFNEVHATFISCALFNFTPDLSLEKGLWLQWKNRFKFITEYPVYFCFLEQFKNSPLIQYKDIKNAEFRENMKAFVRNAVKRGELKKMEPELFWSIAYGPFYALTKFHLQAKSFMGNDFRITDPKLKQTLQMVLAGLKP